MFNSRPQTSFHYFLDIALFPGGCPRKGCQACPDLHRGRSCQADDQRQSRIGLELFGTFTGGVVASQKQMI